MTEAETNPDYQSVSMSSDRQMDED